MNAGTFQKHSQDIHGGQVDEIDGIGRIPKEGQPARGWKRTARQPNHHQRSAQPIDQRQWSARERNLANGLCHACPEEKRQACPEQEACSPHRHAMIQQRRADPHGKQQVVRLEEKLQRMRDLSVKG